MTFNRGDIVLANFPFTDATGSKKRPGLVVQSDHNNRRLQDVILALITSNTQLATKEPTQLLIDIAPAEGERSGLLHTSAVKCEHLITIHHTLIDRVIGKLSTTMMKQIDECLKVSLEIQ